MRNCFFIFYFSLIALVLEAQTVRNVKATQEGQKIAIAYELVCTQPTEINLFLSEDNGQTWNVVKTGVSGDVGTRITQGSKVIYWDVLQSKEKLVGNAFVFKVKVGEEFKTVKIGNQVWMLENLNVVHYANGDPIPEVKDEDKWSQLNSGAWCYYDSDIANGKVYGKLYNWYAVNDARGLAPKGWHIPTDAEWTLLTDHLGGMDIAGTKMKSTSGWWDNRNSTNSSGFSGLPGGSTFRDYDGDGSIGYVSEWWSSTEYDTDDAWYRKLTYYDGLVNSNGDFKYRGLSVRCLRD
jgi:hypothetical protein